MNEDDYGYFPRIYDQPAHVRYEFGELDVGERLALNLGHCYEPAEKIQALIASHGKYYGKKFKTKKIRSKLYIERVS